MKRQSGWREIVKEEIGGEVKKIKETMLTSKYHNPNAKDKEIKRKRIKSRFYVTGRADESYFRKKNNW